jgi:hypothetical protein
MCTPAVRTVMQFRTWPIATRTRPPGQTVACARRPIACGTVGAFAFKCTILAIVAKCACCASVYRCKHRVALTEFARFSRPANRTRTLARQTVTLAVVQTQTVLCAVPTIEVSRAFAIAFGSHTCRRTVTHARQRIAQTAMCGTRTFMRAAGAPSICRTRRATVDAGKARRTCTHTGDVITA